MARAKNKLKKRNTRGEKLFTFGTRRGMISIILLCAVLGLLIFLAKPLIQMLPLLNIPCVMHLLGFNCPFCGGTRCIGALLNFDIKTAFYYNPIVVIVIFLLLLYFLFCIASCFKKEYRPPRLKLGNTEIYIIITIVLLFTVVRNLPLYRVYFY